jgi:hypothetical protein
MQRTHLRPRPPHLAAPPPTRTGSRHHDSLTPAATQPKDWQSTHSNGAVFAVERQLLIGWGHGVPDEALVPPSTGRIAPVMYPASGLARNSAALAISSGWATRLSATRSSSRWANTVSSRRCWERRETVKAGAMAFTRTPSAPRPRARLAIAGRRQRCQGRPRGQVGQGSENRSGALG